MKKAKIEKCVKLESDDHCDIQTEDTVFNSNLIKEEAGLDSEDNHIVSLLEPIKIEHDNSIYITEHEIKIQDFPDSSDTIARDEAVVSNSSNKLYGEINNCLVKVAEITVPRETFPCVKLNEQISEQSDQDYGLFYCQKCQFKAERQYTLNKHMKKHDILYVCEQCSFSNRYYSRFLKHVSNDCHHKVGGSIQGVRKTINSFNERDKIKLKDTNLQYIQTAPKHYTCEICSFRTSHKWSINRHMQRKHNEQYYQCHVCPFKSKWKQALKIHIFTHTGDNAFPCTSCSYVAHSMDRFKRHMEIHTSERIYTCELCPYKSNRKLNLKTHSKDLHKRRKRTKI